MTVTLFQSFDLKGATCATLPSEGMFLCEDATSTMPMVFGSDGREFGLFAVYPDKRAVLIEATNVPFTVTELRAVATSPELAGLFA